MITDAVLQFFKGLVNIVFGWLPSSTPPNLSGDVASIAGFFHYFGWLNQYIPLAEAVAFVPVVLVLFSGTYIFRAAVWLLTKGHILGGASD